MPSKKAQAPAPAAAQPAESQPITRLPFGEGTPPDGSGSYTATGTAPAIDPAERSFWNAAAPEISGLVEQEDELAGELPQAQPEGIPLESIPKLIFTDQAGNRYFLEHQKLGLYMLRPKPGG